jgi:hypothetical protein
MHNRALQSPTALSYDRSDRRRVGTATVLTDNRRGTPSIMAMHTLPIVAVVVAGLVTSAGCGAARADWRESLDQMKPQCRHTPIGQMTHAQLEECDIYARAMCGMGEAVKAQRENRSIDHANCRDAEFIAR